MARWALISAEHGAEATACALEVFARLTANGIQVGGFVQRKHVDEEGRKTFDVVRLRNQETAVLSGGRVAAKGATEAFFCSGAFHDEGFEAARRWVEADAAFADVLVVDGGRKLEAAGKGHGPTLERALCLPDKVVLLCAKASQLFHLVERFGLEEASMVAALELPVDPQSIERFVGQVSQSARVLRSHSTLA